MIDSTPVQSIADFKKKYGEDGLQFRLVIEDFARQVPAFPNEMIFAKQLGIMLADLEMALRDNPAKTFLKGR